MESKSYNFNSDGFSLLEVLVAFVIASISLVIVLRIISNSSYNAERLSNLTHALEIAQSIHSKYAFELPVKVGSQQGDIENFHWQSDVRLFLSDPKDPVSLIVDSNQQASPQLGLFLINITVEWLEEGGHSAKMNLNKIKVSNLQLDEE